MAPRPHVVVVPFPVQGHINPLMEFAKRLLFHNTLVTFVTTETVRERMIKAQDGAAHLNSPLQDIRIETISDGLPSDGDRVNNFDNLAMEADLLRKVGSISFEKLIERLNAEDDTVSCIVYDSFLDWVPPIAKKFGIPLAFFWTESCAVFSIYYHYNKETAKEENKQEIATNVKVIPGLPQLAQSDLPLFLQPSNPHPTVTHFMLDQITAASQATWILVNSFSELEATETKYMESLIPLRTVGPLIPSTFSDGKNPKDLDVGVHLWKATNCIDWLNTKEDSTVIYVAFGSLTIISKEQIYEIALGLKASGYSFLWVIRPGNNKEENIITEYFPEGFFEETRGRGLVVPWCPQLMVLSHSSVGLFLTHCGWNSTVESLGLGLPLLTFPQWTDQFTNSKYIQDQWKTGIRLKKRDDGLIGREEVEKSIKEVMETERGVELKKNALGWKIFVKKSMGKGGSSEKNIGAFVEEVIRSTS